ncbi:MAG: HU family DNA-binding protein [Sulfitobacter sp.]
MSTSTSKATKTVAEEKQPKAAEKATKSAPKATKKTTKSAPPAPAKTVSPTVVDAPQAVISGPMMRKKELVDLVVSRSGMKKKDVKPVVETMLAVLGEALGDNRELNLPPFGRLKVRREKSFARGRVVVAKIRQVEPPLADLASDSSEVE